jgi:nitroreductase
MRATTEGMAMDTLEAMNTCVAMRYLKPDPIPEELLRQVLHAATRASSPGNSQAWEFVVLRDPAKKKRIGDAIAAAMRPRLAQMSAGEGDPVRQRMLRGLRHLLESFASVPAFVFVCGRNVYPTPEQPIEQFLWSALYPAAQNLIVAARALGLGTTFTTLHGLAEPVVRETLAIPDEVRIGVMIPIGFPERGFGPVRRKPLDEVVHWETW